jgi:tripeptidyl-peptidase I
MTRMKSLVALLAAAAVAVNAVAIPPLHEVHEKRQTLHPRWTKRDRVESHKVFQMRVGLKQSNLEKGYEHLMDV